MVRAAQDADTPAYIVMQWYVARSITHIYPGVHSVCLVKNIQRLGTPLCTQALYVES
jgi:hypothetical protein